MVRDQSKGFEEPRRSATVPKPDDNSGYSPRTVTKEGKRRGPRPRVGRPGLPRHQPGYYDRPRRKAPSQPSTPSHSPSKPLPRGVSGVPRVKLPRPRRLPLPGLLRGLGTIIDYGESFARNPNERIPPRLPWNYVWCAGPIGGGLTSVSGWPWKSGHYFTTDGACNISIPLTGQGVGTVSALTGPRHYWRRKYQHPYTGFRSEVHGNVLRVASASPQPQPYPVIVSYGMAGNPNVLRYSPPEVPAPYSEPELLPQGQPLEAGFASPLADPFFSNPELPYQPDAAYGFQFLPAPALDASLDYPNIVTSPEPPVVKSPSPDSPVPRRRPRPNERQGKLMTKSLRLAIGVFRSLDGISEAAEVVSAFYDALPLDVRRRWDRPKKRGDSFGQYGLDGADWKLQALFWNWHRVDFAAALRNVVSNELSDAVIGRMKRGLPKQHLNATKDADTQFAVWLDDFFDWVQDNA